MEYRMLGRSGLKVSTVCLGTMTFAEQTPEDDAHKQLDLALDRGVTFWDTAEVYPVPQRAETYGMTETFIGNWLKKRGQRNKIVLATKVIGPNDRLKHVRTGKTKLDRANIVAAIDASLKRLQTDYVDLYQTHFPDRSTNTFEKMNYQHAPNPEDVPLEETLGVMRDLVKAGKIRAYGVSNETPWGLTRQLQLAKDDPSLPRVASVQNPYSLLNRGYDMGMAEISVREDCPLMAYSPLAFGTLTGKYVGGAMPTGSRMSLGHAHWARYMWPRAQAATAEYTALARKHGLSPGGMAMVYVMTRPWTGSTIIGARTVEQLNENLAQIEATKLSDEVVKEIDAIYAQNPMPILK